MSLVAYESSDESEEEKTIQKAPVSQKKAKESVKIRIPSLKEFEDDEETPVPVAKKPKPQSGSGLFSLLPPPKNSTTLSKPGFVPHILSSKKEQPPSTSKGSQSSTSKKIISNPPVISEDQESDDESPTAKDKLADEDVNAPANSDFFWLDDLASDNKNKLENEGSVTSSKNNTFLQNLSSYLPSTSNNKCEKFYPKESEVVHFPQHRQQSARVAFETENKSEPSAVEPSYSFENYSATESVVEMDTSESLLKDKEFLKLQGRKKGFENIDIIDVNADDQLTDKNEWLMKNLTEESTHRPARKKHNMPTQQQKRKHQITYLAFQAKERENDLKNQWSSNNRTRRETQAKYGF